MPPLFNCRLLEILDISDNAIEIVPQEMNRLEALRTFNFSHCPVKSINCKEWICGRV
jgi:Leucine-rich repeat (LRR) protein